MLALTLYEGCALSIKQGGDVGCLLYFYNGGGCSNYGGGFLYFCIFLYFYNDGGCSNYGGGCQICFNVIVQIIINAQTFTCNLNWWILIKKGLKKRRKRDTFSFQQGGWRGVSATNKFFKPFLDYQYLEQQQQQQQQNNDF